MYVCVCVCVCVCLCLSVCVYVPRNRFLKTVEVIIVKVSKVTASDMIMHHVLKTILTLTFIQCHTHHNHENNKVLIMSETIQTMPIKFAVKIV